MAAADPSQTTEFADDAFIASLVDDPPEAMMTIAARFEALEKEVASHGYQGISWDRYLDAYWFLQEWAERKWSNQAGGWMVIDPRNEATARAAIQQKFAELKGRAHQELTGRQLELVRVQGRGRYAGRFGDTPIAEMTSSTVSRVQTLINELRQEIQRSEAFDERHRSRLLRRLEKLQASVHERMSDLDQWWAFVGEAALTLGKAATDVKPVVDRLGELVDIFSRATGVILGLPSSASRRQLPGGRQDE